MWVSSQGLHFRIVLPCTAPKSNFKTGPGFHPQHHLKKGSERHVACDSQHPKVEAGGSGFGAHTRRCQATAHWAVLDFGWRAGSVGKSTYCSGRSGFSFQHPQVGSQLLVTPRVHCTLLASAGTKHTHGIHLYMKVKHSCIKVSIKNVYSSSESDFEPNHFEYLVKIMFLLVCAEKCY